MLYRCTQKAGPALPGTVWTDRMLEPGERRDSRIQDEVRADVVILLLSTTALASKYFQAVELRTALARNQAGTTRVVPVILERCSWGLRN